MFQTLSSPVVRRFVITNHAHPSFRHARERFQEIAVLVFLAIDGDVNERVHIFDHWIGRRHVGVGNNEFMKRKVGYGGKVRNLTSIHFQPPQLHSFQRCQIGYARSRNIQLFQVHPFECVQGREFRLSRTASS